MKKQKLILFDWGNIVECYSGDCYNIYDAFNDLFKDLGYNGTSEIFDVLGKYHLTTIPTMEKLEKTYEEIKKDMDLTGNFEDFVEKYEYYFDKIVSYQDVRDYEVSLGDRCYIGIFSNLLIIDKKRLDKQVGLTNYDYTFLSYEMACRKPDLEIYEKVQAQLPFDKKDILFIDDRSNNVEAAKNFGWNAVQATGLELEKIKKVCEEFLNN